MEDVTEYEIISIRGCDPSTAAKHCSEALSKSGFAAAESSAQALQMSSAINRWVSAAALSTEV
jgi:hypothetical protein